MSATPPSLQDYNSELVECIEVLSRKREELQEEIIREENDKAKIQRELTVLTERLNKTNESLKTKIHTRTEYDKTIKETNAAYLKILESAQTLVHVLRREQVHLGQQAKGAPEGFSPEKMIRMAHEIDVLESLAKKDREKL